MFKLLHSADWHFDVDKLPDCKTASDALIKITQEIKPHTFIIAGDIWNKRQVLNVDSAVKAAKETFIEIANLTPTILIKGNAAHDAEGSLELFRNLQTKYPVFVTEKVDSIILTKTMHIGIVGEKDFEFQFKSFASPIRDNEEVQAIFHLLSYPEKGWFLKDKEGLSTDESNMLILEELRKIFIGFGAINSTLTVPKILVFHGNIAGSRLSNGQTLFGQDIHIPKDYFDLAQCDIVCAGHIHAKQKIGQNIFYSGSIYHTNHGETEKKYILLHEISNGVKTTEILLPSIPLSQHTCTYNSTTGQIIDALEHQGELFPEEAIDWEDAKLRIRITLTKEQNIAVTDQMIEARYPGAFIYQIERNIETIGEVRAEAIIAAERLRDKVQVWSDSKVIPIDEEILSMADSIETALATEE